jgi:peroxin-10
MLLPILYKLFPRRNAPPDMPAGSSPAGHVTSTRPILPLSPPLTPTLTAEENIILHKTAHYDDANTYLTPDALELPERQCILCLEPRGTGEGSGGTVAVTECGHIFCWGCLGGLEKVSWHGSSLVLPVG